MGNRGGRRAAYEAYFTARRWLEDLVTRRPPLPGPLDAAGLERVLLVCTGLLGDTVMSLPAIAAARARLPRAEIIGLVSASTRDLLSLTGTCDRFIVVDGAPLRLRPRLWAQARALQRRLRREKIGLAVVFLGDDYAPLLTRAGIPHRIFVAEAPHAALATATYSVGDARTWGRRERLRAWEAVGIDPPDAFPPIRPPKSATDAVLARIGRTPRPWVLFHPFGRTRDQWWPRPEPEEFVRVWRAERGGTVFLTGGRPGETPRPGVDPATVDLFGTLTLEELVALLDLVDIVVTTDSGPYHLAGAMGRPGVALFRASRPEHAHRYPSLTSLVAPALPECDLQCAWDRCAVSPCRQMAALTAARVAAAAAEVLGRR